MAQFDVYSNPSTNSNKAYPYLVDIQSPVISEIATRIVIPLSKKIDFKNTALRGLTLELNYEGEQLVLLTPQLSAVPAKLLKQPIGSLSHLRDEIIATLDFAITGV